MSSARSYVVRFAARTSMDDGFPFQIYLRDIPGTRLSQSYFGGADGARGEHEFLFVAPTDHDPAIIDFDFNEADARAPFWLDDVRMYPVDARVTDPAEVFRLEHNRTDAPVAVALPEPFVDITGAVYEGSVTIPPHGSRVLLRAASVASPVITSAATASGTVGLPFTYAIAATGAPTRYGAEGLPAGLAVDAATGVIAGTPTAAGSSTVTVSAVNARGVGTRALVLTVVEPGGADGGAASDGSGAREGGADAGGGDGPPGGVRGTVCGCATPGRAGPCGGGLALLTVWATLAARRRRAGLRNARSGSAARPAGRRGGQDFERHEVG